MWMAAVALLSTSLLNQKPMPVYADVLIGDRGPYRFLVDTGAQTSLIDPKLAADLKLAPAFRVEIITQNSSRLLPGLKTQGLRIGETKLTETELVFDDLAHVRRFGIPIRGILGANALAGLNFTLIPSKGRLEIDSERPAGDAVPLQLRDGRMAVTARMGDEELRLVLDSGASNLVFFRTPVAMSKVRPVAAAFGTIEGARSVVPTCWSAPMNLGSLLIRTQPAAIVDRRSSDVDGLLPAALFKSVYVDQRRGEVVLTR
jgi:predicted aspartyl protease